MLQALFVCLSAVVGFLLMACSAKRETPRRKASPFISNSLSISQSKTVSVPKTPKAVKTLKILKRLKSNETPKTVKTLKTAETLKTAKAPKPKVADAAANLSNPANFSKSTHTALPTKSSEAVIPSQDKVDLTNPETLDPKAAENETYYGLMSAELFPARESKEASVRKTTTASAKK